MQTLDLLNHMLSALKGRVNILNEKGYSVNRMGAKKFYLYANPQNPVVLSIFTCVFTLSDLSEKAKTRAYKRLLQLNLPSSYPINAKLSVTEDDEVILGQIVMEKDLTSEGINVALDSFEQAFNLLQVRLDEIQFSKDFDDADSLIKQEKSESLSSLLQQNVFWG